ncbi:hypothetical protein [Streptomyces sp. NPDC057301]|uniref:hypothetical protein n=1 Tax=Streptomyces sp. NPDC057301 TaxID=3346093 RepID=UPI003641FF9A
MRLSARVVRACLVATGTALVVVASSGCNAGDSQGVRSEASASQSDAPTQDGAAPSGNAGEGDDRGLRYASCMRDNGIQVGDPNADGVVQVPSGIPQSELKRAEKVCGKNPTGQTAGLPDGVDSDPKYQALSLEYDACLRKNGYVPPPKEEGSGGVAGEYTPELQAADQACKAEKRALTDWLDTLMQKGEQ